METTVQEDVSSPPPVSLYSIPTPLRWQGALRAKNENHDHYSDSECPHCQDKVLLIEKLRQQLENSERLNLRLAQELRVRTDEYVELQNAVASAGDEHKSPSREALMLEAASQSHHRVEWLEEQIRELEGKVQYGAELLRQQTVALQQVTTTRAPSLLVLCAHALYSMQAIQSCLSSQPTLTHAHASMLRIHAKASKVVDELREELQTKDDEVWQAREATKDSDARAEAVEQEVRCDGE